MRIEMWPKQAFGGTKITVVNAEAQVADEHQKRYQVLFRDSSGEQLIVQFPDTALRNLVETGKALLGLEPKPKGQSVGKKHSKR